MMTLSCCPNRLGVRSVKPFNAAGLTPPFAAIQEPSKNSSTSVIQSEYLNISVFLQMSSFSAHLTLLAFESMREVPQGVNLLPSRHGKGVLAYAMC